MSLNNYQISKNFNLSEFVNQNGDTYICNQIYPSVNICALVYNILQPLRDHINSPIEVISGFRTVLHNQSVGGVDNSNHLWGYSADIRCKSMKKVFDYMITHFIFDELILEHGKVAGYIWIHVTFKIDGKNRMKVVNNYYKK